MKLQFDPNNNVEDFTFVLSSRGYEHYGVINHVKTDSVVCKQNLNSANELSFEVYKYMDDKKERLWNKITDLKLVWVKELNEYFEIHVSLNDSITPVKTITGTSLCEAELSQVYLHGIEINTEADIERDDYVITKFYNPDNKKGSLLHRVLDKMPNYNIKHVDTSLMNLQRSFSIDGTTIYDFLTGECAEQFDCLFLFDTTDRSISVYDLYTVCNNCGHRAEYNDVCPKCNSTNLKYYGEDTTIYVDKENLTESVSLETDVGSIKNCFKLVAGDDDMTAAIRNINPSGSDYIICIPDWQKEDMPVELREKLNSYNELLEEHTAEYEGLAQEIYKTIDDILYYESGMMPTIEQAEITASTEAAELTDINLSPLALSTLTESTSKATVESALKNYAKVYVKTGYVKLEVNQSEFTYIGEQSDGFIHGTWKGNFKITNYSDEEDIAESPVITIDITDNYEDFVTQKVMKAISNEDNEEGSVFDVLSIDELSDFQDVLKLYGLNRLTSFYDAIQGALDVLIQLDQAEPEADLYSVLYEPYYKKLEACQAEIDVRATTIKNLESKYNTLIKRKNEIQDILNFEKYLGEELFLLFCSYRREDTYSNDNYISDGLDNAEIFDNARKFLEVAKKELYKASQKQHTISSTLHNLLIMPEFSVLTDNFELGNWIRIGIDEEIYRLRLISYEINFSEIQTLNVEFSSVTKQADCVSDIQSILNSAQSMATGFPYVSKQAEKGKIAKDELNQIYENGVNSALINITNNDNEEVIYGKYGILCREYDDIINDYSPEQLKITHNLICLTNNNWKSVECALGKHNYTYYDKNAKEFQTSIGYGLSSKFVTAGYIYGSQIIAGEIYSTNYSSTDKTGTYIDLYDGSFSWAGEKIVYNAEKNILTLKEVGIDWSSSTTPEISDIDGLSDNLETMSINIDTNSQSIVTEILRATEAEGELSSKIEVTADSITFNVSKTYETKEDAQTQYSNLSSQITQTANDITLSVTEEIAEVKNYIDTTKSDVTSYTDEKLKAYSTTTEMNSAIELTAESITSTVNEKITETKEYIDGEIETTKTTLESKITQTASSITSEVSKKVGNDEIISKINQTAETITISAKKIDIDGVLDIEKLNALEITAGSIDAENITGTTISGKNFNGGSITQTSNNTTLIIKDAEISGGYNSQLNNWIDFSNGVGGIHGMAICSDTLLQFRTPKLYIGKEDGSNSVYLALDNSIIVEGYSFAETDDGVGITVKRYYRLTFRNGILVGYEYVDT